MATPCSYQKSAFGQTGNIRFSTVTDGLSNTVFMGEILQGEQYDIRGVIWQSIAGGSHFMSRFTPNSTRDVYGISTQGDALNQVIFCVNEPVMGLPCVGGIGDSAPSPASAATTPAASTSSWATARSGSSRTRSTTSSWLALNSISSGEVISADAY